MSSDRHVASKAVGEWNKSLCNDRKLRIANELLQTAESRQIDVWGAASGIVKDTCTDVLSCLFMPHAHHHLHHPMG
jgi:hypothetical protein